MPPTRLPTRREMEDTGLDDWISRGYFVPVIDFVTAEDMTRERDRETKREHSQARLRSG